jgi:hypothetical protein
MSFLDFSNATVSTGNFEPVPEGVYVVRCDSAEMRDTKDGTGKFIKAKFKITGGQHANRVVFKNFNVVNKSPKAQEIGRGEVKALLLAAGKRSFALDSVTDLCGLTVAAKVGLEKGYNDKIENSIKGFMSIDNNTTTVDLDDSSTMGVPF